MKLDKANIKKILGIILFTVLLLVGLQNFSSVLGFFWSLVAIFTPCLVGAGLAFLLNVPMSFVEGALFPPAKAPGDKSRRPARLWWRVKRPVSLVLTLILVGAIILVIIFLIVPELGRTFQIILDSLPAFTARVSELVQGLIAQYPDLAAKYPDVVTSLSGIKLDWDAIGRNVMGFLQNGAVNLVSSAIGVTSSIINGVFSFSIGFIFALYLLIQKETLGRQVTHVMRAYLPDRFTDPALRIARLTSTTFSRFLSGQCLEAVILGSLFFFTMSVFRFPYALMISVLIAVLSLIPIFGAFIGCVTGAFLILIVNPVQAFWFIVLFLVVQQFEGNFIYPHVLGNSVGLPSLWVLVAVTVGGSLMGVLGMLIFIPLCSLIYTLLRTDVRKRLAARPAAEEDPASAPEPPTSRETE